MTSYLRVSQDFQKVYQKGKRYEGVLMTAFVLPNDLSHNRFGITASYKAVGNAVQRNRAKRLLKETFRLKISALDTLPQTYDWVINAIEEFETLLIRVANAESKGRE